MDKTRQNICQNMRHKMYRQGDLLFKNVTYVPDGIDCQKDGVIARGEVTGHMHRISDAAKATLWVAGVVAYVRAIQDADIVHDEHDTITLPPGDYQVFRQREYRPDGWVQVAD